MEWIKAKNIIIVMFVILNLFLFAYSGTYRSNSSTGKETYEKIIAVLDNKGVELDKNLKVPLNVKDTSLLVMESVFPDEDGMVKFFLGIDSNSVLPEYNDDENVKTYKYNGNTLIIAGSGMVQYLSGVSKTGSSSVSDIDYTAGESIPDEFDDIFTAAGLDKSSYILDKIITEEDHITYCFIEKFKGFLIYDNFIKIKLSDNEIEEVSFFARNAKRLDRSKNMVLSPYHVLLKNYYFVSGNTVINDISYGYKEIDEPENLVLGTTETFLSPAWRVVVNESEEHYFKAYDGERIK